MNDLFKMVETFKNKYSEFQNVSIIFDYDTDDKEMQISITDSFENCIATEYYAEVPQYQFDSIKLQLG